MLMIFQLGTCESYGMVDVWGPKARGHQTIKKLLFAVALALNPDPGIR